MRVMMEAVQTSETSVNSYQSTRRYNPEDSHLQANSRSAANKIVAFHGTRLFINRVHRNPVLGQMNAGHTLSSCLSKILFKIFFPSMTKSSKWSLLFQPKLPLEPQNVKLFRCDRACVAKSFTDTFLRAGV
jgi:hypothetical protein